MGGHAFVTWVEIDAPWQLEEHLLSSGLILPLSLDGNPHKGCNAQRHQVESIRKRQSRAG